MTFFNVVLFWRSLEAEIGDYRVYSSIPEAWQHLLPPPFVLRPAKSKKAGPVGELQTCQIIYPLKISANGVAPRHGAGPSGTTPLGLAAHGAGLPRVAPATPSQPWALGRNRFGIQRPARKRTAAQRPIGSAGGFLPPPPPPPYQRVRKRRFLAVLTDRAATLSLPRWSLPRAQPIGFIAPGTRPPMVVFCLPSSALPEL